MKLPISISSKHYHRVFLALLVSNSVSLFLFGLRAFGTQSDRYWFLLWNLFLAWLPLVFAWALSRNLLTSLWSSWKNIALTLLWLGFLPNSFYLITDLIHLHQTGEVSLLYDAVMFMSFIFNGYTAGFMSLFFVHRELLERLSGKVAYLFIGSIVLLCSFAIYLGRSLRWNTWDILVNPAGILFDVSDRFINPSSHPDSILTTVIFFVLLMSAYAVVWELVRALRSDNR